VRVLPKGSPYTKPLDASSIVVKFIASFKVSPSIKLKEKAGLIGISKKADIMGVTFEIFMI
jgi:hypothetical protein